METVKVLVKNQAVLVFYCLLMLTFKINPVTLAFKSFPVKPRFLYAEFMFFYEPLYDSAFL